MPEGGGSKAMDADWSGVSESVAQTMAVGRAIGASAEAGLVVALVGELGSGKTQTARGIAAGMGIDERQVASPTFVMAVEHEAASGLSLVHLDAYRVDSLGDLESIGWTADGEELRRGAVVLVEWADRLGESLGEDRLEVTLEHAGPTSRRIAVRAFGRWRERLGALGSRLSSVGLSQVLVSGGVNEAGASTGACPICDAPVEAGSGFWPFCSKRCRMVDLGRWLGGDYMISRPIELSDIEEGD